MTFYSKLTGELKRQFKTSDIPIPETRAKCVAVAQRIQEGLHRSEEKKSLESYQSIRAKDNSKYPCTDSKRDQKDRYHLEHQNRDDQNRDDQNRDDQNRDDQNKEKRKSTPEKEPTCFKCYKPSYYATSCLDLKEFKKAKV